MSLNVHIFRFLLTGEEPVPAHFQIAFNGGRAGTAVVDSFFENREVIEVLAGNLFDGDMGYNMVGFNDQITVISLPSTT